MFSTFKGGNNQVATQNKMFGNTKCKCDREFVQVRKNILFHSCHLSFIMTMLPEKTTISSIYYILRVKPVQDFFLILGNFTVEQCWYTGCCAVIVPCRQILKIFFFLFLLTRKKLQFPDFSMISAEVIVLVLSWTLV